MGTHAKKFGPQAGRHRNVWLGNSFLLASTLSEVRNSWRSKLDFDRDVFVTCHQGVAPLGLDLYATEPTLPASRLTLLRLQGGLNYVAPPALGS